MNTHAPDPQDLFQISLIISNFLLIKSQDNLENDRLDIDLRFSYTEHF